jgi:hypothetical protein
MEDAYDAARENASKDEDGVPKMNGVRIRLVPRETAQRVAAERRRKELEEKGLTPPRYNLPFYPFP